MDVLVQETKLMTNDSYRSDLGRELGRSLERAAGGPPEAQYEMKKCSLRSPTREQKNIYGSIYAFKYMTVGSG